MSNNGQRSKRIFISDLHLGDERSLNPGGDYYPYVWLYPPRTQMLGDFLGTILQSDDVAELIILGDLFDQWVCPTEFDPTTYQKVAKAKQNIGILENLRKIASHKEMKLHYVHGNHDMLLEKEVLEKIIPGVIFHGERPGEGVFQADGIAAEHGSMYTMFCSPDTWSHVGSSLPLGFFISRVVAHKNALFDEKQNFLDVLILFIEDFEKSPELAKDVFEAITRDCCLPPSAKIDMNKLDNNPDFLKVEEVTDRYANLFTTWGINTPTGLSSFDGVICEVEGLALAACKEYFKKKKADIVIFGHTHKYVLDGYILGDCSPRNPFGFIPCKHIYANSGTWINSKQLCTYVETEINRDKGRHYVRLFQYTDKGEKTKIKERFVKKSESAQGSQ